MVVSGNENEGWIKLHRKSLFNGWLKNHKLWIFWCYCLLKASHKEHKVIIGNKQITLKPGQFIFGREKAAKETDLSPQSIRTCVHNLYTMGNLTIKSTNKYSLVTIVNWELYQNDVIEVTNKSTSNQPAVNHIQECKNVNNNICDFNKSPLSLKGNGKNPKVKGLIDYFFSLCREADNEPEKVLPKDCNLLKSRLQQYSEEQIKYMFDFFLKSEKAKTNSLSIAVALSNHSISEYNRKGKWVYEG